MGWHGFLRHFRHKYEGKVIVLSGRVGGAFKPIGMAAERSGADAVVSKPTGKAGDGITDSLGEELKSKIYELLEIASRDVMPAASLDQPHAS